MLPMTWTIMIHRISIERLRGDQIHGTVATVAIQMISFPVQLASPPLSLSSELTLIDLVRFSVLTENGHHFLFVRPEAAGVYYRVCFVLPLGT
jgi:hypothetical protein